MIKQIIFGIATFVPGVNQYFAKGTGGTVSARYCYSIWLRHLVMAKNNGLNPFPKILAELGPGDSLGIGLAALISGCDRYYALDIVEHANVGRNLEIFDELVTLFQNRAPVPGEEEFPRVTPLLEKYDFPADILDENRLQQALEKLRIARIRDSIIDFQHKDSPIRYIVPWNDASVIENQSVDLIYSQAVLEHVDDLFNTYKSIGLWLKPTGYTSHSIDFRSHGFADEWNGHWAYSDFIWKLIKGRRPFSINREPHSTHIVLLKKTGFKVICDKIVKLESNLPKSALAPRFRSISDDDFTTSTTFIQAVKIN
jgi:hypothetical protein